MKRFRTTAAVAAAGIACLATACGGHTGAPKADAEAAPGSTAASAQAGSGSAPRPWQPVATDSLWPCSLIPQSALREWGLNADPHLKGTSFSPGQVYTCTVFRGTAANVVLNVGSGDPSGSTAGYSLVTLPGGIAAWQKVESAAQLGAHGSGWGDFIQILANGQGGDAADLFMGAACGACSRAEVIAVAQQVASAAFPAEKANGGAPPSGTQVVSLP